MLLCHIIAVSPTPCQSNPCKNGGTCFYDDVDDVNGYKCLCFRGYTGDQCKIGKYSICVCISIYIYIYIYMRVRVRARARARVCLREYYSLESNIMQPNKSTWFCTIVTFVKQVY